MKKNGAFPLELKMQISTGIAVQALIGRHQHLEKNKKTKQSWTFKKEKNWFPTDAGVRRADGSSYHKYT